MENELRKPDIDTVMRNRIIALKEKIADWDELAKDNEGNKHNLSTSERQDWVEDLIDLNDYFC